MSDIQRIINVSRSFESILLEKEERSRKTAWRVAAAGLVLAALAITSIIILLPLKTTDIELWSVDKQTGRYEYMTRIKERDIASEKALAHSLAAHYVRLREGYNYFSLQRDYDDVQLFNSNSVNRDYLDGFNLATLRIKRTLRRISDNSVKTDFWNIRLTYRYVPHQQLTDSQREVNPLGFIVTSYQRDKELRSE